MVTTMKDILEKAEQGEHLTDAQMLKLYRAYQSVVTALMPFGDLYRLVLKDALNQSQQLRTFLANRKVDIDAEALEPTVEAREGHSWSELPTSPIAVEVVNRKYDANTNGFLVKPSYIDNRKPIGTKGTYKGWVPGAGGDLFWIQHEDGTVAAYAQTELQPV